MAKQNINIQDGYLFNSLRSGALLEVQLLTGERLEGRLRRFDRFALILETAEGEILVYKHGIVSITAPGEEGAEPASDA